MKIKKILLSLTLILFLVLRGSVYDFEEVRIFGNDKSVLVEVIVFYMCVLSMRFLQYRFKTILPAVAITIAASVCDILICDGIAVLYLIPVSLFTIAHNPVTIATKRKKGVDLTVMLWIFALIALLVYLLFELYRVKRGIIERGYTMHEDKYYYIYYAMLIFIYWFLAVYGKHLINKQKSADAITERHRKLYALSVVSFLISAIIPLVKGYMCFIFPFFDFWCVNLIFLYIEGETILVSLINRFGKNLHRFLLE